MSLKRLNVPALVWGRVASPEITQLYIGKKIPDDLRKKGAMSPVRYSPGF